MNAPTRPSRARLAILATVAALLAVLLVHLLLPGDVAAPPPNNPASAAVNAPAHFPQSAPSTPFTGPAAISVQVQTCAGLTYEEATVTATLGARVFTAPLKRHDERTADAVIEVPRELINQSFSVALQWHGWTSPPTTAARGNATITTCPGATVVGRVLTSRGVFSSNVKLELRDAANARVALTTTDAEGNFTLIDPELRGTRLVLPELDGPDERRPILPLEPLEKRHVDVLVGPVRTVVGWVLDPTGDPQFGVRVAMTWEATVPRGRPTGWTTTTDARGQFEFKHAPLDAVRIRASGGGRGDASARIRSASLPSREEITLVLEPGGRVRVRMDSPPPGALVVVRTRDPLAHGGVTSLDATTGGGITAARLYRALEPALRRWNDRDPENSLTSVALAMMQPVSGSFELQLDDALSGGLPDPELLKSAAQRAARRAIAESPETANLFSMVARRMRSGMDFPTALGTPLDAVNPGWTAAFGVDDDAPAVSPSDDAPQLEADEKRALLQRFGASTPAAALSFGDAAWTELTHGAVDEWLDVKSGFRYEVAVRVPGVRGELRCGEIFVGTGEDVELGCGKSGDARIEGRVVDVSGRPVEGADVRIAGATGRSSRDGRFQVLATVVMADAVDLWICKGCAEAASRPVLGGLRNVRTIPAGLHDVGDVVIAEPPPGVDEAGNFNAAGGAMAPVPGGFFVESLDTDGFLELQGVEPGHRLVRVGDEDAGQLLPQQVLRLLRDGLAAEPSPLGAGLILMLRTVEGELYPVPVGNPEP